LACWTESGEIRLVIEQPAIRGEPATLEQIHEFFAGSGWHRFTVNGDIAYFDPETRVARSSPICLET
jgi:hypothetical protein